MKPINKILFISLPFLMVACSFSSQYKKPSGLTPNQWTVPASTESAESSLPFTSWWNGFDDPVLNQLIESGLIANNNLNISRGHVEAAEGELKKIHYQWIPEISLNMGYSNNPATGFPGLLAVLAPSYSMNFFKQYKEQKRAEYQLAAVKAEDDGVKLNVITQISATYFTYLAEVERKQLLQNLIDDISNFAVYTNSLYQQGIGTNQNVAEAAASVNLIKSELEIIEQNIVVSRNALHYLINQAPGQLTTQQKFINLNNKNLIPGQLPMTVLENRPDIQLADNQLRAANEGIGLATSNLLPTMQLDFIGGPVAGNNAYHFPNPITTNVVDFNDELLQIPLLKLSALGEIAKAKGLEKVSYYNYIEVLQRALRDTTNALSANYRLNNKLQQTESAQLNLARSYNLNNNLYKRGIQSKMEMLRSKIALDKVNINVNQDKLQQLLTVVNLYHELAGGYKVGESQVNDKKA